jgi:prokaryotic ubiquitin-like protein Pup
VNSGSGESREPSKGGLVTMATKDTGGQERASRQTEEVADEAVDESSELKERHAKLTEDVDDVLDEIDEVLESDAESFIRSYVQKGGQ